MPSPEVVAFASINASLFGILAGFFLARSVMLARSEPPRKKKDKNHGFMPVTLSAIHGLVVSFLNCFFCITIALDMGLWTRSDGAVVNLPRWLVYTASCPFLIATVCEAFLLTRAQFWVVVTSIGVTLFTGFLVTVEASVAGRWLLFSAGFLPYMVAMFGIIFDANVINNWARIITLLLVLIVWNVYPIVFALGPAMSRHIGADTEFIIFAVLDWFAKMVQPVFLYNGIARGWFKPKQADVRQ